MAEEKILLVSSQSGTKDIVSRLLRARGYRVAAVDDGYAALRIARSQYPYLAIIDRQIKGMDSFQLGEVFEVDRLSPIAYILDDKEKMRFEISYSENVFGSFEYPISPDSFYSALSLIMMSLDKVNKMQKELDKLKNRLANQKIIEKAKYGLISQFQWDEDKAYAYLRKKSMDECKSLVEVAKEILEGKDAKTNKV